MPRDRNIGSSSGDSKVDRPMSSETSRSRRGRLHDALGARLSPDRTRRPTYVERLMVRRLSWSRITVLNTYLEVVGKIATVLWVAFIATVVLSVDWREVVESLANAGRPVRGALILALLVPTLLFVAARSLIGFARWRLQRELWRRDVERLSGGVGET